VFPNAYFGSLFLDQRDKNITSSFDYFSEARDCYLD
jgi:hypothetical protein